MGPFDRFNDRAKRVLALAQDEAIRLNHDEIRPEHLLLGLVREGEGVAARVLDSLGIDLSRFRRDVESAEGRGTTSPTEIRLSAKTKKIVEYAIDEARSIGHQHVGTEHLLLASVRVLGEDAGGVAAKILVALGVPLERIRHEVISTLGRQAPMAREAPPVPPSGPPDPFDASGKRRDWYCEDVLSGKLEVRKLFEDERVLGIEHPYPQHAVHGVVIPKTHVPSLLSVEALDPELLRSMLLGVQSVARALGLDTKGFRVEANAAAPGVTPHMHWHVVGPDLPPPRAATGGWVGAVRRTDATVGPGPTATGAHVFTGPFDRSSDAGKRVLALAQDEAIRFNHNYIGTEHLLAGLVREDGLASRALTELGVEISKVRTALEFIVGRGERSTTPSEITLSPRTKKVIELAIDEARRLGHRHVGAEHILLGLVREGEGIASGVLESLGLSLGTVRAKVIELMGSQPPPSPPPAAPPPTT